MKFDSVVIMGEEFVINMSGEVSHLPLYVGPLQALFPHQPPVSSSHKNSGDETTDTVVDLYSHDSQYFICIGGIVLKL